MNEIYSQRKSTYLDPEDIHSLNFFIPSESWDSSVICLHASGEREYKNFCERRRQYYPQIAEKRLTILR